MKKIKCIYCLQENDIDSQESKEHIFPKTFGGQRRLPSGIVCDTCNSSFSSFEAEVSKESLLAFPKQFYGPLSKKAIKKKSENIKFSPMTDELNDISIGYLQEGKPFHPPQIKYKSSTYGTFLCFDDFKTQLDDIAKFPIDNIKFFAYKEIIPNEPILLLWNKKLYGYYNPSYIEDKKLIEVLKKGIVKNKTHLLETYLTTDKKVLNTKVSVHQNFSFSIDSLYRVVTKIVLNTIAMYHGDLIYSSLLDELRNYVRTGSSSYVPVVLADTKISVITSMAHLFKDSKNNHLVLISGISNKIKENSLIAIVDFYDGAFCFGVHVNGGNLFDRNDILHTRALVINYKRNDEYGDYEIIQNAINAAENSQKEMYKALS